MNPIDPNVLINLEFQKLGRYASEKLDGAEGALASVPKAIKGFFVDIYEKATAVPPPGPTTLDQCMANPNCKGAVGIGIVLQGS